MNARQARRRRDAWRAVPFAILAIFAIHCTRAVAQNDAQWIAASSLLDTRTPTNGAGRFLHFTDLHPDKYYTPGARINDACHNVTTSEQDGVDVEKKKKKKHKKKPRVAGYWGTPNSVCDSPEHLIKGTMEWLAREWTPTREHEGKRAFDFIIWTGDTARHDLDFTHPHKAQEIFDYNRRILALVKEALPGTPVVPNIGNNDIIPHNIMFPGPNSMTRAYLEIWAEHIPQDQQQAFMDGGYFVQEVIPGDLAVISMNTLYFYDANTATRGCKKRSEPGSIQLDWLAEELAALRARGMQAHLIGHVPPTSGNYYSACYSRYNDIVLRYQDTIVGQHFGHMNIDAWFLQEDEYLLSRDVLQARNNGSVETSGAKALTLADDLRKDFDLVPTRQKANADAYLPFFAAPSIVPTYMPTVRVWTYNASRPADRVADARRHTSHSNTLRDDSPDLSIYLDDETVQSALRVTGSKPQRQIDPLSRSHRRPRGGDKKRRRRRQSPHVSPDSPSRKNKYLTMLGYSQWVLDLDWHNSKHKEMAKMSLQEDAEQVDYHLEYTTYDCDTLWGDYVDAVLPAHAHRPVPKQLLDREIALRKTKAPQLQGSAIDSAKREIFLPRPLRPLTDYSLASMTVEHVLEWARELAADDALWSRFVRRIYAESGAED